MIYYKKCTTIILGIFMVTTSQLIHTKVSQDIHTMQEGTLLLTNKSGVPLGIRIEVPFNDGEIKGSTFCKSDKKIYMPTKDFSQWILIENNVTQPFSSPISIKDSQDGTVWGVPTDVYVLNVATNHANLFKLKTIAAYTIVIKKQNEQEEFVLQDSAGKEIASE